MTAEVYHVSVAVPPERQRWFPTVATGHYEKVHTDKFPHEVIAAYAERHANDLCAGSVIVAHRERDAANFTAVVSGLVREPQVKFA